MPVPKKKRSARKRGMRRSHDSLTTPAVSECPNCHEVKQPHNVCPHCGYYKEKEILRVEEV